METITLIFSEYEIQKYLDVGEENGFTHSNTINFLAMLKKQEKIWKTIKIMMNLHIFFMK